MPWTDQTVAYQLAVAKRTTVVSANIFDAKYCAIQHCQNHKAIINLDAQWDVRLQLAQLACESKVCACTCI